MNSKNKPTSQLEIVVDALQLFEHEITRENQEELIDKYVALKDPNGFGSPFGDPNKNQETVIYEGYDMQWSIRVLNDDPENDLGYVAHLSEMIQKIPAGDKGFFDQGNPISVNDEGNIVGNVRKDDAIKNDAVEHYTLTFYISKGDEMKDVMAIDPKLLIKKKKI